MIKGNFITIFKSGNKLITSNKALSNEYLLKAKHLQPIRDTDKLNSHIECEFKDCACRINSFVWISKKRKAIWFEIPKSASRSILKNLNLTEPSLPELVLKIIKGYSNGATIYFGKNDLKEINNCLRFIKLYNSLGLNFYIKKEFQLKILAPNEALEHFKEYYSFAIIRNPYDRMISNYRMFTRSQFRFEKIKNVMGVSDPSKISFHDFVIFASNNANHHWEKQVKYLPLKPNNLSCLGTIDTLSNDWVDISDKLKLNKKLLVLNSTNSGRILYDKYYNKDTFELVTNQFIEDIELYSNTINEDIYNNLGRELS